MACMMDGAWWVGRHGGDFEVPAKFVDLNWGERGGFLHDVFRTPSPVLIARGPSVLLTSVHYPATVPGGCGMGNPNLPATELAGRL